MYILCISCGNYIRRDIFLGPCRVSNYLVAARLFVGGVSFFTTGYLSLVPNDSLNIFYNPDIQFIPQGLVMCFYGSLRFVLSLYFLFLRIFSIGRGFIEYNNQRKKIIVFRWGFLGKNRFLKFSYSFFDVDSILIESQNLRVNRGNLSLYLLIKDTKKILLVQSDEFNIFTLQEMEYFSAELSRFLRIPFERTF